MWKCCSGPSNLAFSFSINTIIFIYDSSSVMTKAQQASTKA